MKEKIKQIAINAKNHVKDQKFAIACGIAVGAIALQQANKGAFYEFLESKGIDPVEYYRPEALADTNS